MVFSSLMFLFFFLPATLVAYYIVPKIPPKVCYGLFAVATLGFYWLFGIKWAVACLLVGAVYAFLPKRKIPMSNAILLGFSLFFYHYGEPVLVLVMVGSILANYCFGLLMDRPFRKFWMICCVLVNLGVLGFFKYSNFFIENLNGFLGLNLKLLTIVMPIGISFFTFQALSYVVDVYRKDVPPQKNPLDLALYISMFPQLIAGPIVRYHDINVELSTRTHSLEKFSQGIDRFIYGLSKKILLANTFGAMADEIFKVSAGELTFLLGWLGAVAYGLQIYFDFSGYSDMAIGLGKLFGFTFLENFNYPYISKSITEFWRRWHISLSTWFRDYVYIPLGGNRRSLPRNLLNILVVWLLTGFWHGASYNFIAWGLFFALFLILEKQLLAKYLKKLPAVVQHLYALFFILLGWVIFRTETLGDAAAYIQVLLTPSLTVDPIIWKQLTMYWLPLAFGLVLSTPVFAKVENTKWFPVCNVVLSGILFYLCVVSLVSSSYNPFIYFRF